MTIPYHDNLPSRASSIEDVEMLRGAKKALSRYIEEVKRATALRHYDYREAKVLWDFTKDNTLAGWDCICDQDIHGKSTALLENNGKGAFHIIKKLYFDIIPCNGKE